MYFIISKQEAVGPFPTRIDAHNYIANNNLENWHVKSDVAMQHSYLHLPIVKPTQVK